MRRISFILSMIILIVISIGSTVQAANTNVEGYVKDAQTGDPLPSANVILVGTSMGAASTESGKYVITNVPPGKYKIRATYIGYKAETFTIVVEKGLTLNQDFKLDPVGIEGKTVVVTAQASGQNAAINKQLSSMAITNVVSAAKIQALPDANAAESVGRLPGVSLIRQGGEGAQVVIRGLSPQYNQITIDGVEMPSDVTSNNNIGGSGSDLQSAGDRGVDLSMISSNMLGGIEVIKSITPDMDAAVLGGVVNFDMRKASKSAGLNGVLPKFEFLSQGEYNNLKNTTNNYKFVGSVEKRYFNNNFGIFIQGSAEKRNLSANQLGVNYNLVDKTHGDAGIPDLTTLNLTDVFRIRKRYGGTVVLDYHNAGTKIGFMNFISNSNTTSTEREQSANIKSPNAQLNYFIRGKETKLNVLSNLLNIEQTFPFVHISLKLSHAFSETQDPGDATFVFLQQHAGFDGISSTLVKLPPQEMATYIKPDSGNAYLTNIINTSVYSKTNSYTASLDLQHDFTLSDFISAKIKYGGMYQYRKRSYDYNESSGSTIYDGGDAIITKFQKAYPWLRTNSGGLSLANFVYNGYDYGTFLNGDYNIAYPLNSDLMWKLVPIALAARPTTVLGTAYKKNNVASILNDYSGHEVKSAAYIMATVNIGGVFTILPGVRYQNLTTSYTGARGENTPAGLQPVKGHSSYDTTLTEAHGFLLPMVHLIYKPYNWLNVHFAYTNTLNYPGYTTVTPRFYVSTSSIDYNNYKIKPATSENYDLVVSAFTNEIGLLTIDGFVKRIKNLIFFSHEYVTDLSPYPDLPQGKSQLYDFYTYINSPFPVNVVGIETDWQTHFWYLPGPLSGLIFSVNYSHIFSKANYPKSIVNVSYNADGTFKKTVVDTFYTTRLLNQPDDIVNLSLGYDFAGFSARLSMLYRNNVFNHPDFWYQNRIISAKFTRWDLSVRQNLPWYGIQLFLSINNITGANDVSINQKNSFPASEQRYGMTGDLGVRVNF